VIAPVEHVQGPEWRQLAVFIEPAEQLLKMPSLKMMLELGRMSEKAGKPAPKPISKAPAPVTPVGGQPKPRQELSDDMPMDEFADKLLRKLAGAN